MTANEYALTQLAAELGGQLIAAKAQVTTAESCTGGGIAEAITRIPGSSAWFEAGYVTYSNAQKAKQLAVCADFFTSVGAVSQEVVEAMVRGAQDKSLARFAVAVSGVAGPDGGSPNKPVGTVWLALAVCGDGQPPVLRAQRLQLDGDRTAVTLTIIGPWAWGEALIERETLLTAMPHISWPMRFVLPYSPDMRFEGDTPTGRLLSRVMPWMKGRRPAWLIRLGLFLYDTLGGRKILPGARTLDLTCDPAGAVLQPKFRHAYEYSDCWVEDSRLVSLNARDAAQRGAVVLTRTRVTSAARVGDLWELVTEGPNGTQAHKARALVNAGGPWVGDVIANVARINSTEGVRLVRGSHIVTKKLYDHDRCYFFQGTDGRIIFAIPYEQDFTLIGTTDVDHDSGPIEASAEEIAYLCEGASRFFRQPVTPDDVVWTYSGVRPLIDDGSGRPEAATRGYDLDLSDADEGAPLLSVYGGKITTYRHLAAEAVETLGDRLPVLRGDDWTGEKPLPGGDFAVDGVAALEAEFVRRFPFLAGAAHRIVRAYGTTALAIFVGASCLADCGRDFGHGLTEREVRHLMTREWARTAEDVLWRRTKLGLRFGPEEAASHDEFIKQECPQ